MNLRIIDGKYPDLDSYIRLLISGMLFLKHYNDI